MNRMAMQTQRSKHTKAERREAKRRPRMGVSGRSVFTIQRIGRQKARGAGVDRRRSA